MEKEEFIADLYEVKKGLMLPFPLEYQEVRSNVAYSIIETLIAVFMDKYNVKYEDVRDILIERNKPTA